MAIIKNPTIKSGHIDTQMYPIKPAIIMPMLANASFRAERKAALVKLPC